MTEGGEGVPNDGSDRVQTRPGSDGSAQTESRSVKPASERRRDNADRDEPSTSGPVGDDEPNRPKAGSTLAEPTRGRLATEESRAAALDRGPITEYTTDRRSLDSDVQVQWALRATILALILGGLSTAILSALPVPTVFGAAIVVVLLALALVWVVLSYRIWVYQIRDDSLYLERGVVTHVRTVVPYVRVQHVDTSRSALERGLGLSTLVVYTAGSRGADVSVPGLTPEEARDLQQRLKELAIEAEGDDAL